jgi:hypothetical protein
MPAGWLEIGEERERLRDVVPPGGTVAEERAKLLCARNRLCSGKSRVVRSIELLRTTLNVIRYRSP